LKHIIVGLFETHDTSGVTMVVELKQIFDKFLVTQDFGLHQGQGFQFANLCSSFQINDVMW